MKDSVKQEKKKSKVLSVAFIAAIVVFLAIVYALWQITDEIVLENKTGFDQQASALISDLNSTSTTKLMLILTFFGSAIFIIPGYFLLAAIIYYVTKNRILSIIIIVIGLLSRLLLYLIKNIFQRDRPLEPLIEDVSGFSYPSGHSFSSFALYGLITYFIWKSNIKKRLKWIFSILLILFAVSIALSRVYLNVHYASDVIAGFCLSLIWLSLSFFILEKIQSRNLYTK